MNLQTTLSDTAAAVQDTLAATSSSAGDFELMSWSSWEQLALQWLPVLVRIVIILVLAWGVWWLISRFIHRMVERSEQRNRVMSQRVKTLTQLLHSALSVGLLTIAVTLVLGELGINLGPIIAAAGIVGLAIGFGAQSLVKDVINGFFFLLEGHVRVGDVIEGGGKVGLVENITLRTLILRDFEGKLHVIPHGEIATVTNYSKDYSRALINVGVAYREDPDTVMNLLSDVANEMQSDPKWGPMILEDPEVFGIDAFNSSDLLFKVRFKTEPLQQWNIARAFRIRIKKRFDDEGVEIPFPHQTLYFGEDKGGGAPPAYIQIMQKEGLSKPESHDKPTPPGENVLPDDIGFGNG